MRPTYDFVEGPAPVTWKCAFPARGRWRRSNGAELDPDDSLLRELRSGVVLPRRRAQALRTQCRGVENRVHHPSFAGGWTPRSHANGVSPDRKTGGPYCGTASDPRAISRIVLPLAKSSSRTPAIVFTVSISLRPLRKALRTRRGRPDMTWRGRPVHLGDRTPVLLSFGATHLGAVYFLAGFAAKRQGGRCRTITLLSSRSYPRRKWGCRASGRSGPNAYLAMAASALAGRSSPADVGSLALEWSEYQRPVRAAPAEAAQGGTIAASSRPRSRASCEFNPPRCAIH